MSQHWLKTTWGDKPVEVMMGWDRPLQGFFMMVFRVDQGHGDEEELFVFNNLDQEESHPKTLDPFLQALDNLGIVVPAAMLLEVKFDGESNRGNRLVRWTEEGVPLERP